MAFKKITMYIIYEIVFWTSFEILDIDKKILDSFKKSISIDKIRNCLMFTRKINLVFYLCLLLVHLKTLILIFRNNL